MRTMMETAGIMCQSNKVKYDKFNPDPYGSHKKIIQFVGKNKRVLDVGCSTGQIAKRLVNNGCEVIGIEIDKTAAVQAKKYCKDVIVGDVELIRSLPYPEKYFDVLLFADVLEHLREPLRVLTTLRKYLRDDGHIIVSLPNVANWRIRLQLLFGNFEYKDAGILDKTHLRFFTYSTAKQLLEEAGFEIIKFDITPSFPFPFLPKKIKYQIAKMRPNLFAIQFLMVGRKNEL